MEVSAKHGIEETWHGVSASDGVVIGTVLRLQSGARNIFRATLHESDVERETRRLRAAVRLAKRQLLTIRESAERELGTEQAYIFDAHLLILEDRKLLNEVEDYIRRERANAEWAVKVAADKILSIYAEIKDDYLRERGSDIEDVTQRIIAALGGETPSYSTLNQEAVIVAEDLLPSAVAELDFRYAKAIATDAGGWTSHTSILARSLGIPAVVGLRDFHRRARTGDEIIIDGIKGDVYLHPDESTLARYRLSTSAAQLPQMAIDQQAEGVVVMADGVAITLSANLELPSEYEGVQTFGAAGVGLFRSEFLLSQGTIVPDEDEQCRSYTEVGRFAGENGATIRLFDLGGDKIGVESSESERNPALGLRAIRLTLRRPEILRTQLRAILRAASEVQLRIVLPMIADVSDIRRTRAIVDEERQRLVEEGKKVGEIQVGAMIEVPSAVMTISSIVNEVDFLSLGTNDLVQYLLAVDRGNEQVADWFRTLHPAVLKSVCAVVEAADAVSIPVTVCGEMAASPAYAVVLIGLGVKSLSMTPHLIPRMRSILEKISAGEATEIAYRCLECVEADDVEDIVREEIMVRWPDLFPPKSLPVGRSALGH